MQDRSTAPVRRGRPPKNKNQDEVDKTEDVHERKRVGRKPGVTSKQRGKVTKGQRQSSPAEEEPPSAELRRSGRERRTGNRDGVFSTKQSNVPSRQDNKAPDNPASVPSSRGKPKSKPPRSISRPSGRERRSPRQQSDEQEVGVTQVGPKTKSKKQAEARREEVDLQMVQKKGPSAGNTKRRRGRPSLNPDDSRQDISSRPKNKRAKDQENASDEAQSSAMGSSEGTQPKRRGRPRISNVTAQETGPDQPSKPRASRPKQSPSIHEEETQQPIKTKRKVSQRRADDIIEEEAGSGSGSDGEGELEKPFRYLKQSTRNIPRSTISAKWGRLDGPSINSVASFLADAQRPVLLRLQNTNRRREHASSAIGIVSRRLRSKLIKGFPFPAPTTGIPTRANIGSHEDEFDFERTVDILQNLENMLNPLLHSVSLLEKEIKKEENALDNDYDSLHKLEANARSKTKEWREKAKREHVLAPSVKQKGKVHGHDIMDRLELVQAAEDGATGGLFKVRIENVRDQYEPRTDNSLSYFLGSTRRGTYYAVKTDWESHGKHQGQPAAD